MASLNQAIIERVPVILPPRKEQEAIAAVLGALDDKIELNRRMNRTLDEMARAIFKSWFVDFDPVRAKAAGSPLPGLAPHLAALFPDSFTDSPLGPIPTGWEWGEVNRWAYLNAWTLSTNDPLDTIDYIEISKVMNGEISEISRYERGTEPSRARRRLQHGDSVLSTVRPDRGAHFLCLDPAETLVASTGFAVLTPKDGRWAFVYVAVTRPEVSAILGRLADGGAYPAVRPEVIGSLDLVGPSDTRVIGAFERIAQPMLHKAHRNRSECATLAALRDALVPKLISGELRIPDAERIVGLNT